MADARTARLEQLARQVFEDRRFGRVMLLTDGGVDVVNEAGGLLAGIAEHPRALEAMEAALCVLAGESLPNLDRLPALVADLDVRLADAAAKLREVQESIAQLRGEE